MDNTTVQLRIHNHNYEVDQTEFQIIPNNKEYEPLTIRKDVSDLDREIGFLKDVGTWLEEYDEKIDDEFTTIERPEPTFVELLTTHGGYVIKNIHTYYNKVEYFTLQEHIPNSLKNIHNVKRLNTVAFSPGEYVIRAGFGADIDTSNISSRSYNCAKIILLICSEYTGYMKDEYEELRWQLPYTNIVRKILVLKECYSSFKERFGMFIRGTEPIRGTNLFTYDNLLNLLIMVKNAGDDDKFQKMIEHNMTYCNKFCILDTGSTDKTLENIKNATNEALLNQSRNATTTYKKYGKVFREPFINFRDSRNRLFRLAGEECTFNIMLDDTYYIREGSNFISFLHLIRGDDFARAYSISVISYDQKYGSVRLTKSFENPMYKYVIHEVVEMPNTVKIPEDVCTIYDEPSTYMKIRTSKRKEEDLRLLYTELEKDPNEVRQLYYLAETYLCIASAISENVGDSEFDSRYYYEMAKKYYDLRAKHDSGYHEEVYDSLLKSAFLHHMYNVKDENVSSAELYKRCIERDPNRYDGYFLVGYSIMTENNPDDRDSLHTAYTYFKKALEIGLPPEDKYSMNVKLEQFLYHLPNFLMELCYLEKNYILGEKCADMVINYTLTPRDKKRAQMMKCIYSSLNSNYPIRGVKKLEYASRKLIVFVIDGGWKPWDGRTIETEGLGGSETCIIKYAETINATNPDYHCVVFCRCNANIVFKNVEYIPIQEFSHFISRYQVHTCFVNRYTEIAPLVMENNVRTIIMLHDLCREEEFIPDDKRLEKVLCLSDYHLNSVANKFPYLNQSNKLEKFSYGLEKQHAYKTNKIPNSFIYSSFPTRGLLPLLTIFPKIVEQFPDASLNIFCDLDHEWSNSVAPELMNLIKSTLNNLIQNGYNIKNHGWVSKKILNSYWETSEYWLYLPTHFAETFCLTALEAFQSKTVCMYVNTGSLGEVINDRGLEIPYNHLTCVIDLTSIFSLMQNSERKREMVENAWNYVQKEKDLNRVVNDFCEKFL
jgi:hypothetical protein